MCPSTRWICFSVLDCFLIQSCVQVISTFSSGKFISLGSGNNALDNQAQDLEKNDDEVVLLSFVVLSFVYFW